MTTKMLNINGKILLGVFSLVLVIIAMIPLVLSVAGGSGKAKGNSCMASCLAAQVVAEWYSLSNERVQECRYQCGTGVGEGVCTESNDGCCVFGSTSDPDCELTYTEVTIHVQYSNGDPIVTTVIVENSVGVEMGQGYTDGSGNYKIYLKVGSYSATAEDPLGGPSKTEYFTIPDGTTVTIQF